MTGADFAAVQELDVYELKASGWFNIVVDRLRT